LKLTPPLEYVLGTYAGRVDGACLKSVLYFDLILGSLFIADREACLLLYLDTAFFCVVLPLIFEVFANADEVLLDDFRFAIRAFLAARACATSFFEGADLLVRLTHDALLPDELLDLFELFERLEPQLLDRLELLREPPHELRPDEKLRDEEKPPLRHPRPNDSNGRMIKKAMMSETIPVKLRVFFIELSFLFHTYNQIQYDVLCIQRTIVLAATKTRLTAT